MRIEVRNRGGCCGPACRPPPPLPIGVERARRSWRCPSRRCSGWATAGACSCPRQPALFEIRKIGRGRDLGTEVEVLSGLARRRNHRRRRRVPAEVAGREAPTPVTATTEAAMIARTIRTSFQAPLITSLLIAAGAVDRRALAAGPPPRRVPRSVGARCSTSSRRTRRWAPRSSRRRSPSRSRSSSPGCPTSDASARTRSWASRR